LSGRWVYAPFNHYQISISFMVVFPTKLLIEIFFRNISIFKQGGFYYVHGKVQENFISKKHGQAVFQAVMGLLYTKPEHNIII
jgi:hypothetical protein